MFDVYLGFWQQIYIGPVTQPEVDEHSRRLPSNREYNVTDISGPSTPRYIFEICSQRNRFVNEFVFESTAFTF